MLQTVIATRVRQQSSSFSLSVSPKLGAFQIAAHAQNGPIVTGIFQLELVVQKRDENSRMRALLVGILN